MPFAHFAKGRPKRKDTAGLNSAKSVQPSRSLARDNRQLSGESPLIGGRTACNRQAVAMSSASLQKSVGFPTNDRRPPTCPGQDRLLHRSKSAQKDNELDAQVGPSAAFVQPSRLNGDFPPRQSIRPVPERLLGSYRDHRLNGHVGAFLPRQPCGLRWLEAEIRTDPLPGPSRPDRRLQRLIKRVLRRTHVRAR